MRLLTRRATSRTQLEGSAIFLFMPGSGRLGVGHSVLSFRLNDGSDTPDYCTRSVQAIGTHGPAISSGVRIAKPLVAWVSGTRPDSFAPEAVLKLSGRDQFTKLLRGHLVRVIAGWSPHP